MLFHRILSPLTIRLQMQSGTMTPVPEELPPVRRLWLEKERILEELVEVLSGSGQISSSRKLFTDLVNRERRQSSGIGDGIAIPHLRTLRARSFVMGFCRSERGLSFGSIDDQPVKLFFPMVAPPHDDRHYLRILRALAVILQSEGCRKILETTDSPHEIIRCMQDHSPWS